MELKFTEKQFKNGDRLWYIEKPFEASKSSSLQIQLSQLPKKICSSHLRGHEAELIARKFYCEKHGWKLISSRYKTPFAEVDFIFQNPCNQFLCVEVKSFTEELFQFPRVSQRQIQKLEAAHKHLQSRTKSLVEMRICFIRFEGLTPIYVMEIDFVDWVRSQSY